MQPVQQAAKVSGVGAIGLAGSDVVDESGICTRTLSSTVG